MQSSEIVLYNLSKQAEKKEFQFDRLYRYFYNEDFYLKAYSKIGNEKKLMKDDSSIGIRDDTIQAIINSLKDESYRPKSVQLNSITKKNRTESSYESQKFTDRLVQEVCRMLLESIYEPSFSNHSHSFRANRSCHTALTDIKNNFGEVTWFIEGNITECLNKLDHQVLISIIRKRIKDEKFIRLIWKFLKAGYAEIWARQKTYSDTPIGGIISPILGNIYLNELDIYVEEKLKISFEMNESTKCNLNDVNHSLHKEIKLNQINQLEMKKKLPDQIALSGIMNNYSDASRTKKLSYVRYANRFVLGIKGSKMDCQKISKAVNLFLLKHLKLELPVEKKVDLINSKSVNFLNYDISFKEEVRLINDGNGTMKREYSHGIQLKIPKGTIEKVIVKNRMVKDIDSKKWVILHHPKLIGLPDIEIIKLYNASLLGLYNYYALAENMNRKMWQVRYVMEYSCLKTLAIKYKSSVSKMKTKFSDGKYWGVKSDAVQDHTTTYFYKDGFPKRKEITKPEMDYLPNFR